MKRIAWIVVVASAAWTLAVLAQVDGEWTKNRMPGTNTLWTAERTSNEVERARAVGTNAMNLVTNLSYVSAEQGTNGWWTLRFVTP